MSQTIKCNKHEYIQQSRGELLAQPDHQDHSRYLYSFHHCLVFATQWGQTVPLRCGKTLDVRFCDCHLRLPDLQDRWSHQARAGFAATAVPAVLHRKFECRQWTGQALPPRFQSGNPRTSEGIRGTHSQPAEAGLSDGHSQHAWIQPYLQGFYQYDTHHQWQECQELSYR